MCLVLGFGFGDGTGLWQSQEAFRSEIPGHILSLCLVPLLCLKFRLVCRLGF